MIKVAFFGVHKFLLDTLVALEKLNIFPQIVIFPTIDSTYHTLVEDYCIKHQIPFIRPASVNDPTFLTQLANTSINRIIVTGYNEIFSKNLIDLGTLGAINCHGGLLPEERGPVPYKWAIYDERTFTGVTYHQMTEKLDKGKVFVKNQIRISDTDTNQDLFQKICIDAAQTLPVFFTQVDLNELIQPVHSTEPEKGKYKGQIPERLTHFDLSLTVDELIRRVRAFSPRPGVFLTESSGRRLLITGVSAIPELINSSDMVVNALDGKIAITDFEISNS